MRSGRGYSGRSGLMDKRNFHRKTFWWITAWVRWSPKPFEYRDVNQRRYAAGTFRVKSIPENNRLVCVCTSLQFLFSPPFPVSTSRHFQKRDFPPNQFFGPEVVSKPYVFPSLSIPPFFFLVNGFARCTLVESRKRIENIYLSVTICRYG